MNQINVNNNGVSDYSFFKSIIERLYTDTSVRSRKMTSLLTALNGMNHVLTRKERKNAVWSRDKFDGMVSCFKCHNEINTFPCRVIKTGRKGIELDDGKTKYQDVMSPYCESCFETDKMQDVILVRSPGSNNRHEVRVGMDNVLYCTCPAFIFKGGLTALRPCKHLLYVMVNRLVSAETMLQYVV